MKFATNSLVASALGAFLVTVCAPPSTAGPLGGVLQGLAAATGEDIQLVQYRGGYNGRGDYGRRNYRGNDGRNVGLGIAGLVIGGIILNEAARAEHRGSHGGDWERCAQTYRSFERNTGMYTGYDGLRRPCPYLD
jgi:BA14K-like protein